MVAPLQVTSRVDASVRFVGSTISVLKPSLMRPPHPGLCLAQPALRTQNLTRLLGDDAALQWSSVFLALGTLAPPIRLRWTLDSAREWLAGLEGASLDHFFVRADSSHGDLLDAVVAAGWPHIELDGCDPVRFRHRYGIDGVTGRNVNLALRGGRGELHDFANVIVVEAAGAPVAVEFALGVSAFLARLDGLDHPLQASPIADVMATSTDRERRLADAVAAAALLLSEGMRPVSRGRSGILRRYLRAIGTLAAEEIALDDIGAAAGRLVDDEAVGATLVAEVERLTRKPG